MFQRILRDAFVIVFGNLETVFKVCGAWFVLQSVLLLLVQAMVGGMPGETTAAAGDPVQVSPAQMLASLLMMAVGIVAAASISVAWHRFGLLGERPGFIHLQLGAIEGRFIVKTLLIALVAFLVLLPISIAAALLSAVIQSPVMIVILFLIATVFVTPHLLRLYLVLPAVSVERPIGLKEAYKLGYGLGWPMIGAGIVLFLPFILVAILLQYLSVLAGSGGLLALLIMIKLALLNVLLQIILTVLGISVITAAYRIAMERQNAATQETPSNPA
ncbi:hypothetical protein [uncultured Roseibium sp.]|uniref:hypothetical protein n=1 Tax=uncultured Roseibium sp. TaxID=1936171 RepID=UPI0032164590